MGILAFLVVLCCLILVIWIFGFFSPSAPQQKPRTKSQSQTQIPPKVLEPQEQDTTVSKPTLPRAPLQDETISISSPQIAPRQSPASKKSRTQLPTNKHQLNIWRGDRLLQQLRSQTTPVGLPMVIATLRRMNPYAFEELLLTSCKDQGWQIHRNFRYSNDGGVDGRVVIAGKLYLIQVKRYSGHIKPEHIRGFHSVIELERADGGFFIHTGKTGALFKELLRDSHVILISGQGLVNFILGRKVKIVGDNIIYFLN